MKYNEDQGLLMCKWHNGQNYVASNSDAGI